MYKDIAICGSRLWQYPERQSATEEDIKIYSREICRLELSLDEAKKKNPSEIIMFTHYPPVTRMRTENEFTELIKKYPEDSEILEDVIVENKQAIEMANIYSGILTGTMDTFASVISNNLNIVMKVLAIITIVLSIPTMIFSAYGMNVNIAGMPFATSPYGFLIIISLSVALSAAVIFLFIKLKMFK